MTDPITFTFTQLLTFGAFLFALMVAIFKIGWSVWRIKRNDFGEFIKRDELERLEKKIDDFKDEYARDEKKRSKTMGRLEQGFTNLEQDIIRIDRTVNRK